MRNTVLILAMMLMPIDASRAQTSAPSTATPGAASPAAGASSSEYQIVQTPGAEDKSQAKYQQMFQDAVAAFRAGRLSEAETKLQTVEQSVPGNVTAHSLLGYIYLKENKSSQALAEMQTVVRLVPSDVAGRKNLGRALLQTNKSDMAVTQFQAALNLSPSDADAEYGLALAQAQAGQSDDAAASFRKAIALKPTSEAYQNLAVTLNKSGHATEAAEAYARSASLNPMNAGAYLNAGLLYAQAGDNEKAVPALTQALALGTEYKYEAHMALGGAYAKSDPAQAVTQFQAASDARPTDAAPLFNVAVLQGQAGHRPEAEAAYRKVIALAPSDPKLLSDAQSNLGLLLAQDGNASEGVPLLTQAAAADPTNPVPHLALGNLYAKIGNPQKAVAERLIAVGLAPDDVQTRLLVADSLLAQKKYAQAAAQYDEAVKRQPDNALVQNARGTAYEMAGNVPAALAAFKAAIAANPRSAQAQNNLGVIYEKQGKRAQAIAAYKKAVALDPTLSVARRNLARYSKPVSTP